MEQSIIDIISSMISPDVAKKYTDFCSFLYDKEGYNTLLTSSVFTNLSFKKELAKKIVNAILDNEFHDPDLVDLCNSLDVRLRCLISYYWAVNQFNGERSHQTNIFNINNKEYEIVKMRPGDNLFQGYRCFIVNMLCFTANKFILGFRTDSGPVSHGMKYFKGCRPLGIRADHNGSKWNLILFDRSLTDDYSAIFSNFLDGDGTIEMCDWLSDHHQRLIYRCSY